MKETEQTSFQDPVAQYLIRHRSILDVQSKLVESGARIARVLSEAVTHCGCVRITGNRQRFPADLSLAEVRELLSTHPEGDPCERCRELLEDAVGTTLFYYLAALCHVTGLDLGAILRKERDRVYALGVYHLT